MKYFLRNYIFIIAVFLLAVSSCTKEAPTVNLGDYVAPPTGGGEPGYSYPYTTAVYPAHLSTNVPINTDFVIVFNIPIKTSTLTDANLQVNSSLRGALTQGAAEITVSPGLNYARIAFTPILTYNEVITVTTTSGIQDDANSIPLNNPATYQFTAGAPPDTVDPNVNLATETPTDLSIGIAVNTTVSIDFDETIDPSTINSSTFYLERVADSTLVPATYTYAVLTATLTPSANLLNNTQYRARVTTGVKDLAGNNLPGNYSWQFTTIAADPFPGNPTMAGSPSVGSVTDVSAVINWTTNEATNYTLNYGTSSAFGFNTSSALYTVTHSVTLGGLNDGERYFYNIVYDDQYSGGPAVTSPTYQFNTQTAEVLPASIADGLNYQMLAKYIPQKVGVTNSGAFVFWSDVNAGVGHIRGKLYNNAFAQQWLSDIYTEGGQTYNYQSAVEDDAGGVIVLASHSTGLYAKRLNSAGAPQWGYVATDPGLPVKLTATGTNLSAAPVCGGYFQTVTSGTAEMNIPANPFYDFDQDLRTGIATGDIIYRTNAPSATSDAIATTSTNFRHVIGQSSVAVVSGNTYVIFDSGSSAGPYTAYNHNIVATATTVTSVPDLTLGSPYNSGGTTTYTGHGVTGIASNGNLVYDGTNYARINLAVNTYGPITPLITGDDDNNAVGNLLRDVGAPFPGVPPVESGDYVLNTSNLDLSTVTNPSLSPPTEIGLSNDIFDETTNENYNIYDQYCSVHVAANLTSFAAFDELPFDWGIDIVNTDTFTVYNTSLVVPGTADTPPANPLYDDGVNFSTIPVPVAVNDIVFNSTPVTGGACTYVNDITYRAFGALGLFNNIMSDGDTYNIFRLPAGYSFADIRDSGLAAAGTTANVLRDATIAGVAVGDIVYNVTNGSYSLIVSILAPNYTLSGNPNFLAGHGYIILRANTGILYAWQEGANTVNWRIFRVNGTPPTPLIAEQTIPTNARNPRVVSNGLGSAFIIYENTSATSNILARLIDAQGTNIITTDIDTGFIDETILKVISDNVGGFVILYRRNATSTLHVQRINSSGTALWGGGTGLPVGNPANIDATTPVGDAVDIVYDGGNDVIVAAQIGNNIWAARIGITSPWAGYYITDNLDAIISTTIQQKPKIYSNWTDAVIVWEDNRFVTGCGYGIFGMRLLATPPGTRNALWDADSGAGTDLNGLSIILNSANGYWPNALIVPYNNGNGAQLLWDDWRTASEDSNIESYNLYDITKAPALRWFVPW